MSTGNTFPLMIYSTSSIIPLIGQVREVLQPLLDAAPPVLDPGHLKSAKETVQTLSTLTALARVGYRNKEILVPFYELFVGPATQLLDRWFDSDILKATLATDAVIGALVSPSQPGSAYVLLHHVMGEADGRKGVCAYVEGGRGTHSSSYSNIPYKHTLSIYFNNTPLNAS